MNELSSMIISHKKATIKEMESMWSYDTEDLLLKINNSIDVSECLVLKTCNRIEIYIVSKRENNYLSRLSKELNVPQNIAEFYDQQYSIEHLMRLSCGLESMIIGEDQILGQIKSSYLLAENLKTIGPILSLIFKKIIHVGKKARTETLINKGSVSIGSAAVDLAEKCLNGLNEKTILVIGVGEIGVLVAKALSDRKLNGIYISNRTFEKAEAIALELGGKAIKFEQLNDYMNIADVVISATSAPHCVIYKKDVERLMTKRKYKPLFIVDIANPRDVEESVNTIDNVTLCNIDNLRILSSSTLSTRKEEAKKVEKIISEEIMILNKYLKHQYANNVISKIYNKFEILRKEEEKKAFFKLISNNNDKQN